jgi:NAD(P)-dependent dehydrogenase (short-subunit alcohol dehydrogenase family)
MACIKQEVIGMFKEKIVVVTGSAEGVGSVIANSFAQQGARLILVDFKEPLKTLEQISAKGAKAEFVLCDLRDEEQVIKAGSLIKEKSSGTIDVLVNVAGFNGKPQLVKDMMLKDWNFTISLNLTGTMLMIREMMPLLKSGGKIVNIASNVARRGLAYRADYVCSKWALLGLTQTLALELAPDNIRVNAVCPGPIEGERIYDILRMHSEVEKIDYQTMSDNWKNVPMKRFIDPVEVANTVLFLASDASSAMTGQALNVTGGFIMT